MAQVGIESGVAIGGKTLHLLIEKDFVCHKPRVCEDDADTHPHPLEEKAF